MPLAANSVATEYKCYGKVDDVHLTNVFYNLMENAVKYCKDVPLVITVTTFNAKDGLYFNRRLECGAKIRNAFLINFIAQRLIM